MCLDITLLKLLLYLPGANELTQWCQDSRVMAYGIVKLTWWSLISLGDGSSPIQCQAITYTHDNLWSQGLRLGYSTVQWLMKVKLPVRQVNWGQCLKLSKKSCRSSWLESRIIKINEKDKGGGIYHTKAVAECIEPDRFRSLCCEWQVS